MNTISHGNINAPVFKTRSITAQSPDQKTLSVKRLITDGTSVSETWSVPESLLESFKAEQLAAGSDSLLVRFSASLSGAGPFYEVTISKEGLIQEDTEQVYSFDSETILENSNTDGFGFIFKPVAKNPTRPSYVVLPK